MQNINTKRQLVGIGLIAFILMMFLLSLTDQREDFRLISGNIQELTGPWTVTSQGEQLSNITLPYDMELETGVRYSASTVVPLLAANQDTLLIRSSMQDFWVYLDDQLIHEHVQPEPLMLNMPPTSLWVIVDIPEDAIGKRLRIEYVSKVDVFSGLINEVHLDRKAMILHDLFVSQSFGFAVFLMLTLLGIISIGTSFAFKNTQDLRLFYLGFMSITSGMWILSESRLLQYFIGNRFILGSLSYLMIPIIAFFFALYIKDAIISDQKSKQHLKYLAFVFVALVLLNVTLQITGVMVYIEMMEYTLPIILVSAIYAAYLIVLEITVRNNEEAERFVKFTIILLVSLILEIGSFFIQAFSSISSFFRIGVVIFFGMLAVDTFIYIRSNMRRQDETLLLEKLAYKDFLTGGFNRTAYERDVQSFLDTHKSFRLVLLDLNDLKHINDTYGHNQGDEAIRLVFNAMRNGFVHGNHYRIGGDEFAVLIEDVESNNFEHCLDNFQHILKDTTQNFMYPIYVAVGSDVYRHGSWDNYSRFYHQVDQKMYTNKRKIKSAKK
jgi:diguanylate cyclase (GGDEF)-like protein